MSYPQPAGRGKSKEEIEPRKGRHIFQTKRDLRSERRLAAGRLAYPIAKNNSQFGTRIFSFGVSSASAFFAPPIMTCK